MSQLLDRVRPSTPVAAGSPAASRPRPLTGLAQRRKRTSLYVFLVSFVSYAIVGIKVVVFQHVIVPDGWARLAHAYFVFYNQPAKLAAIGFIWPPLGTLVFLPFAWIKPLATSLVALPVMSAVFAAATLVVLDRLLAYCRLRPWLRYPVIAAFALNPMILFYATNGMGEVISLFCITLATAAMVRWYCDRRPGDLVVLSLALAAGFLTRYELLLWAVAAGGLIVAAILVERRGARVLEGTLLVYVTPIVYGLGLWLMLNWLIVGSPLYWFHSETSAETGVTIAGHGHPSIGHVLGRVLALNAHLFFPTLLAIGAMLVLLVWRRDLLAGGIAAFAALNAAFTGLMFYASDNQQYFELRYNIRSMPAVIAAIGYLHLTGKGRSRTVITLLATVALVLSAPLAWRAMQTSNGGFLEDAFVRALPSLHDQEGRLGHVLGTAVPLGSENERAMARYDKAHVDGHDEILTDDAASFAVMLFDGRPGVYLDRIDVGDVRWQRIVDRPWGRVRFLLVSPGSAGGGSDLALQHWPALGRSACPGFTLAYRNSRYVLYRVARHAPAVGLRACTRRPPKK